MFSIVRHLPVLELLFSNSPIAFVITKQRQLKIYKIKPILGKFFLADEGFFVLDSAKSLSIFKQTAYLYDASNINPLPATKLAELEKLSKTKDYEKFMEKYNAIKNGEPYIEDVNPINPQNMKTLNEWGAVDPQLIAIGTNHLLSTEKLLRKRSNSVVTKFPVMLIIVGIGITFLLIMFGPQIMDMLNDGFDSMF